MCAAQHRESSVPNARFFPTLRLRPRNIQNLALALTTMLLAAMLSGGLSGPAAAQSTAGDGGSAQCPNGQVPTGQECADTDDVAAGIRAIVAETIAELHLKAVIVGVKIGDTPVLSESWGKSMTGVPATGNMHFRNGAVAIAYLSTVLLELQDRGVLSLDDRLSKWFPDYPKSDRITLKMLINSTSGYTDYVNLDILPLYEDVFRHWTPDELIAIGLSQPMVCDPGTCFAYAHTNFVILGKVLSKATGKPVEELIREGILAPLSLKDTRSEATAEIQQPVLHAFTSERGIYEDSTYWNPSWTLARGSIMTTNVPDLLTSAIAIGSGALLSENGYAEMIAPPEKPMSPFPEGAYYGLGVLVTNSWIVQTPAFAGYAAAMAYLPQRRIAIAVTATMEPEANDELRSTDVLFARIGRFLAPDQAPIMRSR
jgi:D-alanyl-D-alanine carboxypeptidase